MSRSFDGANDALSSAGAVVDATTLETTPISFALWLKRVRTATQEFLMITGPSGTTSHYIALIINVDDTVSARSRSSATTDATSTATIADTTSWHLIVGVWGNTSTGAATTSQRHVYVDGNTVASETATSRDPTTATDLLRIGSTLEASFGVEFQGLIAYATVWNTALTAANVSSLWNSGAGVDPTTVANANVVAHWALTDNASPEPSSVGSFDLTLSGTTFSTDNPFTLGGGGGGQAARTSSFMRMMNAAGL